MRFAVLGSNSFSGSSFIRMLMEKWNREHWISRSNNINPVFLPYKNSARQNCFKFYCLDMNRHLDDIIELIKTFRPAYIVNFAAQGMVAQSWDKPEDCSKPILLRT